MVESSIVLYEDRLIAASKGGPVTVEFDFDQVWGMRKAFKNFDPKKLQWIHVHPTGVGYQPSSQDLVCAKSLQLAFGKLGYFGIVHFRDTEMNNIEGEIAWYELKNGQLVACEVDYCDPVVDLRHWFAVQGEIPWVLKTLACLV
jgi:hypothetical protein